MCSPRKGSRAARAQRHSSQASPSPSPSPNPDRSEVGLSAQADGGKMPGQLSGGMLRRAALAQILAQGKRVVVLDEPFVGLDPPVADEVRARLRLRAGVRVRVRVRG